MSCFGAAIVEFPPGEHCSTEAGKIVEHFETFRTLIARFEQILRFPACADKHADLGSRLSPVIELIKFLLYTSTGLPVDLKALLD